MFFRIKVSGPRRYLQIVESFREGQKVRQRVIATLGRIDQLEESGQLESLLASGARFSRKVAIIGDHEAGKLDSVATAKLGPYLVFHRLFRESGIQSCLRTLLDQRRFRFHLEGAVFVTILHRLVAVHPKTRKSRHAA